MRPEWQGKTAQAAEAAGGSGVVDKVLGGTSWAGGKFTDLVGWALEKGLYAAAAAPVIAGVGAGALISSATSPTQEDMKQLEKRMILAEQRRLNAGLRRQLALSRKRRRMVGMDEIDDPGVDAELSDPQPRDVLR